MATTLEAIQAKIKKLQAQADTLMTKETATVLETIHELMEKHGLTTADIDAHAGGKQRAKKAGTKTAGKKRGGRRCGDQTRGGAVLGGIHWQPDSRIRPTSARGTEPIVEFVTRSSRGFER